MRRLYTLTLLMFGLSMLVADAAVAQSTQPDVVDLFSWITPQGTDWKLGILFTVTGLVGALVTTFGLIGGAVSGTAGQARIDADTERLDRLTRILVDLLTDESANTDRMREVADSVNQLRSYLSKERWRQFSIAAFLYAVLGAAFAAALAQDLLQALVIGAGWTGVLGSLGLRSDAQTRRGIKDEALTRIQTQLKRIQQEYQTSFARLAREAGDTNVKGRIEAEGEQLTKAIADALRQADYAKGV